MNDRLSEEKKSKQRKLIEKEKREKEIKIEDEKIKFSQENAAENPSRRIPN